VLLERATGTTLDVILRNCVFGPLGMVDTGFSVPAADVPRLTSLYGPDPSTGALQVIDRGDASSWWAAPPAKLDGSGGLVSTLDDVWSFARMMACGGRHEGEPLLSASSFDLLTTDRLTAAQRTASALFLGDGSGWGLGMATPLDGVGAFGWDGGTGVSWRTEPGRGVTAIVMTQRTMDGPQPSALFRDVWATAFGR